MGLIWLQLIFFRLVIKPGKKLISGLRRKLKVSYFFVHNWQCFISWEQECALFSAVFITI